jgi:VIT1/CCC1 family predicted Fe2+/Mn2+ transporter
MVKFLFSLMCIFLPLASAQSPAPALTQAETHYFQALLLKLASLELPAVIVNAETNSLRLQYGLNDSEMNIVTSVIGEFRSTLRQIRDSAVTIRGSKPALSTADELAIQNLVTVRDEAIRNSALRILGAVRPSVAKQVQLRAELVEAALLRKGGVN